MDTLTIVIIFAFFIPLGLVFWWISKHTTRKELYGIIGILTFLIIGMGTYDVFISNKEKIIETTNTALVWIGISIFSYFILQSAISFSGKIISKLQSDSAIKKLEKFSIIHANKGISDSEFNTIKESLKERIQLK